METRHIKLDYAEGLNGKKQILSSEINLIYISKSISRYRLLRKKEFTLKNQLKTSVTSLRSKLNCFLSTLPVLPNFPKSEIQRKINKKENHETKESKNLSEELRDIQEKLAKLQ
jgi:hypothetical protein